MSQRDLSDSSRQRFASTHWSMVLAADRDSSPGARDALENLCQVYWYPLYAYVRRQGYDAAEAADLTQGFFALLLERHDLRDVEPAKGRFRSFLLVALKHYIANQWDRARAAKRGGDRQRFSIDRSSADSRYRTEAFHQQTPEAIFEKRWAMTLLDQVHAAMRDEFERAGKARQFECLKIFLTGERAPLNYAQAGAQLGLSETAVKVSVYRMRQRFGELLRAEIAHTVSDQDQIDDEIRSLFDALRS